MKKIIILLLSAASLTGCATVQIQSAVVDYDYSDMRLVQLEEPYENQPIAVITTTLGVVKVALFPEYAPNTVENFITNIKDGFYDDSPVMRIQEEAVFFAGADSDGRLKADDDGNIVEVENEYSVNMWPFRGAIGACGNGPGFSDSRFFIVDREPLTDENLEQLRGLKIPPKSDNGENGDIVEGEGVQMFPDELVDAFGEVGCVVGYSGFYTIFGQTIEGLEIVEAICKSEVDERSRPISEPQIKIIKIELEYYAPINNE